MKTMINVSALLAALLVLGAATNILHRSELPTAKVTVRVVDENLQPVENAKVSLGYGQSAVHGTTDANGLFTGEGRCDMSGIGTTIAKDGYYFGSAPTPKFRDVDEPLNRWKPWNETCVAILRPVGKPVALYAKRVDQQIPALDKSCGFDLEAGDWVAPYGKGMQKDFIFTIHQIWHSISDYDVQGELTFRAPLDGLRETSIPEIGKNSIFKWERQAPESGYEPKQELRNVWFPAGSGKKPMRSFKSQDVWQGYFLRVRTVEQDGKIVSAHFGKIRGGIAVYPGNNSGKPRIAFTYYFNPTPNDRNLEWDTKRNLFGGLSDMETPREP